jgi:hypothetical protein
MLDSTDVQDGQESPKYVIDTSWFEENGLSFQFMAQDRMCDACRSMIGTETEDRVTKIDPKTKKVSFEFTKGAFGVEPIKVITECCAKKREFINPEMPTLEAIFRIFLSNSNQPMALEHVREQLAEWCPGGGCQWLLVPVDQLERVIMADTYYGLRQSADGLGE